MKIYFNNALYLILAFAIATIVSCDFSSSKEESGEPADVNGTWNGTWESSYGISGSFTADIVQNGSALSGTIDVPYIGLIGAGLKGTINGASITFGDVNNEITFTGTVNGKSASGSYVYSSASVNGTWTANKTLAAPKGVSAAAGDGQVTISWNAVSDATSYNLYWSYFEPVSISTGTKVTGVTSPYIHTELTNGIPYFYVVTAVNSNGESAESNAANAIPSSTTTLFYTDISLNTPYDEAIESYGTKVYRILTTDAGDYTISLTNLASDLGWTLCSYDATASSVDDLADNTIDDINGDLHNDATDEIYTKPLSASTYYFIVVDEWSSVASSYTLDVIKL